MRKTWRPATLDCPAAQQSCWRWFLAGALARSQGANHLFQFAIKQRLVFLQARKLAATRL